MMVATEIREVKEVEEDGENLEHLISIFMVVNKEVILVSKLILNSKVDFKINRKDIKVVKEATKVSKEVFKVNKVNKEVFKVNKVKALEVARTIEIVMPLSIIFVETITSEINANSKKNASKSINLL
jgi:hypothetical protein